MATIVCRAKVLDEKGSLFGVWLKEEEISDIPSFEVEIGNRDNLFNVIIKPYGIGTALEKIAEIINGCFDKESNFFEYMKKETNYCINTRTIILKYNQITLNVFWARKDVDDIVSRFKIKEKLLARGVFYIIEAKSPNLKKRRGDIYLVLATSEKAAMNKMHVTMSHMELICIGIYNKKENTLLLKNADNLLDLTKMSIIED